MVVVPAHLCPSSARSKVRGGGDTSFARTRSSIRRAQGGRRACGIRVEHQHSDPPCQWHGETSTVQVGDLRRAVPVHPVSRTHSQGIASRSDSQLRQRGVRTELLATILRNSINGGPPSTSTSLEPSSTTRETCGVCVGERHSGSGEVGARTAQAPSGLNG